MTTATVRQPGFWRLVTLRAKAGIVETVRLPIAIISAAAFPALAFLFFVVPNDFAQIHEAANEATIQLLVFSLMSAALFNFGSGIAADRSNAWEGYVRTLPTSGRVQLTARLVGSVPFLILGTIPLLILAYTLTAYSVTLPQAVNSFLALALGVIPFMLLGFAIGYRFTEKGAIAAIQIVFFPMAFAGGLFVPPETFPSWLDGLSKFLPSRGSRDLAVAAAAGDTAPVRAWVCIGVWIVIMGALALWAYRRDEGRNYS